MMTTQNSADRQSIPRLGTDKVCIQQVKPVQSAERVETGVGSKRHAHPRPCPDGVGRCLVQRPLPDVVTLTRPSQAKATLVSMSRSLVGWSCHAAPDTAGSTRRSLPGGSTATAHTSGASVAATAGEALVTAATAALLEWDVARVTEAIGTVALVVALVTLVRPVVLARLELLERGATPVVWSI